jgi:hypothetical protein
MKYISVSVLVFFVLTANLSCLAQSRVIVRNGANNRQGVAQISLKWYTDKLVYQQGVHVYRRSGDSDEWVRLNNQLITLQKAVPAPLVQKDEDLEAFLDMANGLNTVNPEGFVLLNLYVKSFQSPAFAKLLGIQYDDATVEWGKAYEYKVVRMERGQEVELGVSGRIVVGPYRPDAAVTGLSIKVEKGIARMVWKEEEARFYGVNIYRNTPTDTTWRMLNKTPIVMTETDNAPASGVMYQDPNIKERMVYNYRIEGLDFFGGTTARSKSVQVTVSDLTPPAPPVNLNKKVRVLNVQVSWDIQPSADLVGFRVYRSTKSEGPFVPLNEKLLAKTDTMYTDLVPEPDFYYYKVMAVDDATNEGASQPIMVEVQDVVPPSAPKGVEAKADTGKIVLRWVRNPEADVVGYLLFRTVNQNTKENFMLINADPIRDTTYTQVLPENAGNMFLFKVVAVDGNYNRSEPSAVVQAQLPDVTAPIAPAIKKINIKGDTVVVEWLANPEKDLAGYHVYRHEGSNSAAAVRVTRSGPVVPTALLFQDTVGRAGHYQYRVQAVDQAGNASAFSESFPVNFYPPFRAALGEVKVKYNKRKKNVKLDWGKVKNATLKGYTVFRKGKDDTVWKPVSGLLTDAEFEDRGVPKGTFLYQVRAYSQRGDVTVSGDVKVKATK